VLNVAYLCQKLETLKYSFVILHRYEHDIGWKKIYLLGIYCQQFLGGYFLPHPVFFYGRHFKHML